MAQLLADDIDFSQFMEETDAHHSVRKASLYADDVISYFHDKTANPCATLPWPKTHKAIGIRPGEVSLWGGINGHGKSLALGQACVGFARQKQIVVIASLEMRPVVTIARMCRQEYSRVPTVDSIRQFHGWTDKHLYLYDQIGSVKPDKMLAVMRYSAEVLHADHFVIDSLMKCGIAEDDFTKQKMFMDQICSISRDHGMHTHMVHHSRKGRDEFEPPGKMDYKGSGAIPDQADNLFVFWRNKAKEEDKRQGKYVESPDALLICNKQRNGEEEGKFGLFFDPETLKFHETDRF